MYTVGQNKISPSPFVFSLVEANDSACGHRCSRWSAPRRLTLMLKRSNGNVVVNRSNGDTLLFFEWESHESRATVEVSRLSRVAVVTAVFIGADTAGATRNFAPRYSPRNQGKHHVLPRYLSGACFEFWSEVELKLRLQWNKLTHTYHIACWMTTQF